MCHRPPLPQRMLPIQLPITPVLQSWPPRLSAILQLPITPVLQEWPPRLPLTILQPSQDKDLGGAKPILHTLAGNAKPSLQPSQQALFSLSTSPLPIPEPRPRPFPSCHTLLMSAGTVYTAPVTAGTDVETPIAQDVYTTLSSDTKDASEDAVSQAAATTIAEDAANTSITATESADQPALESVVKPAVKPAAKQPAQHASEPWMISECMKQFESCCDLQIWIGNCICCLKTPTRHSSQKL